MSNFDDCGWIKRNLTLAREAINSLEAQVETIRKAAELLVKTFENGNKLLACGNGGSAAEAMHMTEEAIGRFHLNRVSLPAVALVADGTALTCIANDYGFSEIFARQIEGLGKENDLLTVFSSSGNGENIVRAVEAARAKKMKVLLILGRDGGRLAGKGDLEIIVKSSETARVQEAHQIVLHTMLQSVDAAFAECKEV